MGSDVTNHEASQKKKSYKSIVVICVCEIYDLYNRTRIGWLTGSDVTRHEASRKKDKTKACTHNVCVCVCVWI